MHPVRGSSIGVIATRAFASLELQRRLQTCLTEVCKVLALRTSGSEGTMCSPDRQVAVVFLILFLSSVHAFIPDTGEVNATLTESDFSNGIMPVVQWLKGAPTASAAVSLETISSAEPMDAFTTLIGPFGPVPGVQVGVCVGR